MELKREINQLNMHAAMHAAKKIFRWIKIFVLEKYESLGFTPES
jgi:hypothetical protein